MKQTIIFIITFIVLIPMPMASCSEKHNNISAEMSAIEKSFRKAASEHKKIELSGKLILDLKEGPLLVTKEGFAVWLKGRSDYSEGFAQEVKIIGTPIVWINPLSEKEWLSVVEGKTHGGYQRERFILEVEKMTLGPSISN